MARGPQFVEASIVLSRAVPGRFSRSAQLLKRVVDLGIAVPLCIVCAPLFAAVAALIRLESPGPVLFRQHRRGKDFEKFTMTKFRSLRHGAPDPHARYEMLEGDPRITRVGNFIRRTSLDELPQLFNVIAGSMSLVGPRPLVEWESQEALLTHPERFRVKPGITGLSQVEVRNSVDFGARLDKDVEYGRRQGLLLDLKLLLRTPWSMLRSGAVYPDGSTPR